MPCVFDSISLEHVKSLKTLPVCMYDTCTWVWRLGVDARWLLYCSPAYFIKQGLSVSLASTYSDLASLADNKFQSFSCFCVLIARTLNRHQVVFAFPPCGCRQCKHSLSNLFLQALYFQATSPALGQHRDDRNYDGRRAYLCLRTIIFGCKTKQDLC